MRHHQPRQPKKTAGFSWGRSISAAGLVMWRLFRRDQRGALHYFIRTYTAAELARSLNMRLVIADEIKRARHALRDQVDTVDLEIIGVV